MKLRNALFILMTAVFGTTAHGQANGDEIFASTINLDPSFFLFDASFSYHIRGNQDYDFVVTLEDESQWSFLATDERIKTYTYWVPGDWLTITPSLDVAGEYILENKVRTPGIKIPCTNSKLPNKANPKTQRLTALKPGTSKTPILVYVSNKPFKLTDAASINVFGGGWTLNDQVIVTKIEESKIVNGTVVVNEQLVIANIARGTFIRVSN